jgi:hypothetical protein
MNKLHQKDDFEFMFSLFFITLMLTNVVSVYSAKYMGEKDIKKQAIENNAAEYVVDKDGKVNFKWKGQNE